jgi:multidrug efflux pump subunit AcrA (membrane-fusion protein)
MTRSRTLVLAPVAGMTAIGVFLLAYWRPWSVSEASAPPAKEDSRVSEKQGGILKLKSALLAESYGIKAEPAREIVWRPKQHVDGRVIVNPSAQVEVRAPVAGLIAPAGSGVEYRLGASVQPRQVLALLEARFSLVEKVDLKSKQIEAEARFRSAEEVLKIRQERLDRLHQFSTSVPRSEIDAAVIQISEARMTKDIALSQWELWKQALASADKTSITLPLTAPIAGEIAEVGAQPGSNVETGQLLARIVDFKRVLLRLEFPISWGSSAPPPTIDVETLGSPLGATPRWRAELRGPAANVEVGLQKAGYLYEIVASTPQGASPWRPGLFVKASFADPSQEPQTAVAIPASALLVHQGRTLVYIELNVGRYERREVFLLDRAGDTYIVSSKGWTSTTDPVVTWHAQALLSEEFRSDVDDD